MDNLRKSVRPIVTYIMAVALASAFLFLIWKFSNQDIANKLIDSFISIVTALIAFWFGSRQNQSPKS